MLSTFSSLFALFLLLFAKQAACVIGKAGGSGLTRGGGRLGGKTENEKFAIFGDGNPGGGGRKPVVDPGNRGGVRRCGGRGGSRGAEVHGRGGSRGAEVQGRGGGGKE